MTVVRRELPDAVAWRLAPSEPERGEADTGGPALGTADEEFGFLDTDRDAGALEQLSRLGDCECEVFGPQLTESAARPEPA